MLQSIRDKISGWFAGVFLGAIAVVFVFWGIRFENSVATAAAKVNGRSIPVESVRKAWQDRQTELQQRVRDELPPALVQEEQQKLLDEFILRELLVQRANDSGYRVGDKELAETLAKIPALQVDGKFSRDRYTMLLRQQGRSEAEFEREFRRDLETSQLRNAIALSSFVTSHEMDRRVALQGESRDVSYAVLPAAKFADQVQVAPEAVKAYYDKHKAEFMTQDTVALQYLRLNLDDIAANVQVTEEALRKYYDDNAAERFTSGERRKASHILIEAGADDAAAKKKADGILAQIKAGGDFAKLARENSADPGSKAAGGELGWSTREAYVKPFADALFSMKPGEISNPVRTEFGYHIIKLEEVEAPRVKPFEEVRAELEPQYRREQAQNLFYDKSQQLADESFASLSELDSVSKKLNLPLHTVESFTRQGGGDLGNDRKIIDAVFSDPVLQDRQNSAPIPLGEESVVVVRVTDYKPSAQRPLEAVQDEVTAALRLQGERDAAVKVAKELAQKVNAGEAFASATTAAGLQPTASQALTRRGSLAEGAAPVAPELLTAVFQASRPGADGKPVAGTATLANGDQAVFVVTGVHRGQPPAGGREMLTQIAQQTAQQVGSVEFEAYLGELKRTAKVKKNDKVFNTEQ